MSLRQYFIGLHPHDATFPFSLKPLQPGSEIKKAKGVKKFMIQSELTRKDYSDVIKGHKSRSVDLFSLKRKNFRIFLVRNRKRLLTRFNCKRLFINSLASQNYYFSLPLHFKGAGYDLSLWVTFIDVWLCFSFISPLFFFLSLNCFPSSLNRLAFAFCLW